MGLTITLETERGKRVEQLIDPKNLLHKVIPQSQAREWVYLPYIDWYGDTTFNHLQMEVFITEWDKLLSLTSCVEAQRLLEDIRALALRCRDEAGLYLKFYGD